MDMGLPGFGLPLNYRFSRRHSRYTPHRLPLTTLREFTMLQIMNAVTDKPDWHVKIQDKKIASKWKAEILGDKNKDVTEAMANWCIEELKHKAILFHNSPNGGIRVYNGDVIKSDTAVPESVRLALVEAVKPLEDIPDRLKDWHPGSEEKVLDLVHPSLFPLVYGRSKILEAGQTTTLEDCISRCGEGEVIPQPKESETQIAEDAGYDNDIKVKNPYSQNFQWLPCQVDIKEENARITTYINNLHPVRDQKLYGIVEQVITAAIPLWELTLAPLIPDFSHTPRIEYTDVVYDPDPENGPETDEENFQAPPESEPLNLREMYASRGLQIIVKLANIELTPEKPKYEGGTWHVEGQLNEHICATALYYYSTSNITPSSLAFRQQTSDEFAVDINYEQDHHDWLPVVFGIEQEEAAVQDVGSVETRQGRLLTFPNILQHQVQPFELADPTKPGHRKILALFLVDPNIRVISTANVPVQRMDWWREATLINQQQAAPSSGLPVELQDHVFGNVEDFPITLEDAKEIRLELMDERKHLMIKHGEAFVASEFSLCEH
ncbi:uncharacterized protein LACBIDRAFT_295569 [Laccaria bicolor S238N-H82]|uniref:Predicted protein n=1 Tax=Laccaria bicolor (strain S238N-H82 / ATCC MYA-4686) TaxID=486041 RepID=B0DV56_LACBS|nr:uncharacterized protein LACBIDRAFT_295569 [Laccaria bicolor S238N-H82]EDR01452.1 predicted protein [Laccaria bicolor S238N-H82]|eukprot:XP_001887804.1 predicted protein [Laccaria bicolor S238N-H82]